jgi:hypothetical protein
VPRGVRHTTPIAGSGSTICATTFCRGCTKLRFTKGAADQDSPFGGIMLCKRPGPALLNGRTSNDLFDGLSSLVQIGVVLFILCIVRRFRRLKPVESGRVFVAGLSAGGAAAAIMGSSYPDLFAAVGVHSGLACGAATNTPSAFAAMRGGGAAGRLAGKGSKNTVPTIVFHGDRDMTVNAVNGDQVIAQSKAAADCALPSAAARPRTG